MGDLPGFSPTHQAFIARTALGRRPEDLSGLLRRVEGEDVDINMRRLGHGVEDSRGNVLALVAVVAAAFGVFGPGWGWPDLIVAAILATLGITGGSQIMRQAALELRSALAYVGANPSHRRARGKRRSRIFSAIRTRTRVVPNIGR